MNFNVNINDKLICCICMDTLHFPKTLQCGHTLCSSCLQNLYDASKQSNNDNITDNQPNYSCPTCRVEINLLPNSIAVNEILKKMIDDCSADNYKDNNVEDKNSSLFKNNENICVSCKRKTDSFSTYVCNTCDNEYEIKFYCPTCGWKYHSNHDFNKFDPNTFINNMIGELIKLQEIDPLSTLNEGIKEQNLSRINNITKSYHHLLIIIKEFQSILMNKNHITIDVANNIGLALNDISNLMSYCVKIIDDLGEMIKRMGKNEEINQEFKINFEKIERLKEIILSHDDIKNESSNVTMEVTPNRKRRNN